MRGAYGIALTGLGSDHPSLPQAPADWPHWHVEWVDPAHHEPGKYARPLDNDGVLELLPDERRCLIATQEAPTRDAMAHPWLATIGAWVANGRGIETFHAGGVVIEGRVWVILGHKHAGKSTTLAALYGLGYTITSDDLVAVSDSVVLSGPACVDLRSEAADALAVGERVTVMPGRERSRVTMSPPPAEHLLAGFVLPSWNERATVRSLPASVRLKLLFDSRAALWADDRGARMLQLASLPMVEWCRPRVLAEISVHAQSLAGRLVEADQR